MIFRAAMILEPLSQDLRLAWRGLRRARGFTLAAVLTLAVGIAGTTVMFALVNGVLLRPLPVREQDRLLVAWTELRASGFGHDPFAVPEIEVIGRESRLLERVAGVDANGASGLVVVEDGAASELRAATVTGDFFEVLGVAPILGRSLNRGDNVSGAERVLVIAHGPWQRRYGGSREAIGRRLMVNERPFTIVGVMPADVEYPRGVEAWVPVTALASTQANPVFREAMSRELDLMARLRPGATIEQAANELRGIVARIDADAPANDSRTRERTPVVRAYADLVVGDVRPAMFVLFGAVGLVLIIASANVANLLLLRGEVRRPELAVRAALGASRVRLARQVIVESALLALAAGAAGLAASWWTLRTVVTLVPDGLPRVDTIRIDATVVLFTLGAAFLTAALAGLVPALSSARIDLVSQLRSGGRGATGSAARHGRRALVVAQVALAVIIVAAAGVLTRSLLRLQSVDMGLAADRLLFVPLALPQDTYAAPARHLQFLNDVLAQLDAAPGIDAATPVNAEPFSGTGGWDVPRFAAEGQSVERAATNPSLNLESIHPTYFDTFEVALVRGRAFTRADRPGTPEVAIVSEDVATRTWPGEDSIGKRLKVGGVDSIDPWRTVVGVARLTRYRDLQEPRATIYLPAEQFLVSAHVIVLRTTAPLERIAGLVRERVRRVNPDVRVLRVVPFAEMLDRPLARPRFNALLIGVFGGAALLLATIGLYAVMAAHVRQRAAEIGVRVALGATGSDVRRLVLGEGLRLAGVGAAIGLAAALTATRLLRGVPFEVHPLDLQTLDPAALLAAAILLIGASALASYLPARRAARLDPVVALGRR